MNKCDLEVVTTKQNEEERKIVQMNQLATSVYNNANNYKLCLRSPMTNQYVYVSKQLKHLIRNCKLLRPYFNQ